MLFLRHLLLLISFTAHAGDGFVLDLMVMSHPVGTTMHEVEVAHSLGATHFNIPVLLCQPTKFANQMRWCDDRSEYREGIVKLGRELKARGFTVGILPFLMSDDGQWRGFFEPTDFKAWSASYLSYLTEMAEMGSRIGISDFIVGTELNKLYVQPKPAEQKIRTDFWRLAAQALRERLGGGIRVFFVANWDQYDVIPFWDASDFIGLSAYYPLQAREGEDTSVKALTERWKSWAAKLLRVSRKFGRPLYFSEVGYASEHKAAREPWGWEGNLDLGLQERLYTAFANTWALDETYSKHLARFQLWALTATDEPLKDTGFTVIGKPAQVPLERAFRARTRKVPVIFTLDDIPAWFITDSSERIEHFGAIRDVLRRHHVPAVAFVNGEYVKEPAEWEALRSWEVAGVQFANHTVSHVPRSSVSEADFLGGVDAGADALKKNIWGVSSYFRYPNLDFGPTPEARVQTCRALRARGYEIMPVSFDSRDWSWSEDYHRGDTRRKEEVAQVALATIDRQFDGSVAKLDREPLKGSALILLMHSTRFTRDYLDRIFTRLEAEGAQWVAPSSETLQGYRAGVDCLPVCLASGDCN